METRREGCTDIAYVIEAQAPGRWQAFCASCGCSLFSRDFAVARRAAERHNEEYRIGHRVLVDSRQHATVVQDFGSPYIDVRYPGGDTDRIIRTRLTARES